MRCRIVYATFPTSYPDELRNSGQRGKARAFWEYYYDMEQGEFNSLRFYAESWGVGKTTAGRWIDDFKEQIDLYQAAWHLKNNRHYTSIKKTVGQVGQSERDTETVHQAQETGDREIGVGQVGQSERDKALNSNDTDTASGWLRDKAFNDLFFIYASNGKHPGAKGRAYAEYLRSGVDAEVLTLAAVQYLHDPSKNGKLYNLANFISNQAYLPYLPKMIRVQHEGRVIEGEFVEEQRIVIDSGGNVIASLTPVRMVELFKAGQLEFINAMGEAS